MGWNFQDRLARVSMGAPPEPSEIAQLEKLREEFGNQLQQLLTPEEKQTYDLRYSDSATRLRQELAHFAPSEKEFQRLHNAQTEFQGQIKQVNALAESPDKLREMKRESIDKLGADIATALGPGRYEDYLRA